MAGGRRADSGAQRAVRRYVCVCSETVRRSERRNPRCTAYGEYTLREPNLPSVYANSANTAANACCGLLAWLIGRPITK
jgi:hypothetical protein